MAKNMNLVTMKIRIPRPNVEELTRKAKERNNGKNPEYHINEEYLASEIVMLMTHPTVTGA